MSRARELEEAVAKMHASAAAIRGSIVEMVEILRETHLNDRSVGLRAAWRLMAAELTAAAQSAAQALQDN